MPNTNAATTFPPDEQMDIRNSDATHSNKDSATLTADLVNTNKAISADEQDNTGEYYFSSKSSSASDIYDDESEIGSAFHLSEVESPLITDSVAASALFKLPPELRNKIYRLVLIKHDRVTITKRHGIPEPALLSVCKILRSEALGIFYRENEFSCEINKYDSAPMRLVYRKVRAHPSLFGKEGLGNYKYRLHPGRSWANLLCWLREYYSGRCDGPGELTGLGHNAEDSLILSMFGLAALCTKSSEAEWEQVKQNAELVRPALVGYSSRWADE